MSRSVKFANTLLASLMILCVVILFYALSSSGQHPTAHTIKYCTFSITGILFFAYVLLRCRDETKTGISLLMLSVLLSVYLIEIILSFNIKKNNNIEGGGRAEAAKALGIPYDTRSRFEMLRDLRSKGVDAQLLFNPTEYFAFKGKSTAPLGYISDKMTIAGNENGQYLIYKSDEHGFNNPPGLYDREKIDAILIGDSFTLGLSVERGNNVAGNLIRTGRKILNLGVINTGPLYHLAILKEYAKIVKPSKVFWLFYEGNDFESVAHEKKDPLFQKYFDSTFSQGLFYKQKEIDRLLIEYNEKEYGTFEETVKRISEEKNKEEGALFNISLKSIKLPQLRNRLAVFDGNCEFVADPLFRDIFAEAKREIDGWNGQLYFVYLPAWERYQNKPNRCRTRFLNSGKDALLSIIKDLHIPLIDAQTAFDSHPDPLAMFPFRQFGHYNEHGYRRVAEQIDMYLSDMEDIFK